MGCKFYAFVQVLLVCLPPLIWRFLMAMPGLPYAISQAGFFLGIILLVILCAITDWTIRLVVLNAKLSGGNSYLEIMHNCFGPSGRAAVSLFQFTFAFGGKLSV